MKKLITINSADVIYVMNDLSINKSKKTSINKSLPSTAATASARRGAPFDTRIGATNKASIMTSAYYLEDLAPTYPDLLAEWTPTHTNLAWTRARRAIRTVASHHCARSHCQAAHPHRGSSAVLHG